MLKSAFQKYKASFSGLPRPAWLLALVVFVNRSGTMVLFFISLYLTSRLGYSATEAGQMVSIWGLGSMGGSFLGGYLTDRIGSIRVQLISLILSGIGYIILGYMTTFASIALLMFTVALVSEALRPANATAMAEACPEEVRARGFALNRLAINLGVAIGPALGGFLAVLNYTYLFWVDGLTCIFASVFLWFIFGKTSHHHQQDETDGKQENLSPYKDKLFIFLLALLLIMGMLFTQIFSTWPIYLKTFYNLIESRIGILLMVNAILVSIAEMPLVHYYEKKNVLKVIGAGALFLFAGFTILPFGNVFAYAVFTVIIWSIGEMLVFPLMAGWIANRAGANNRGQYMGLLTATFSLSFILGPILGSTVYESLGPDWLWYFSGIAGILTWLGFTFAHKRRNLFHTDKNVSIPGTNRD